MADFEATFVDVGQGDCTLIRLPDGEYMLFDVYRCSGDGIDVFKLLDDVLPDGDEGKKRLKCLVITHSHDDHITGIGELYDRYEVEWLWAPQHEDRKQVASNFAEYQRVIDEHPDGKIKRPQGSRTPLNEKDSDYDICDGLSFRCFSPPGYIEIDQSLSEEEAKELVHENCLVMKVSYEGGSVLITGDSNLACWKRVLGYYDGDPDSDTGTEVLAADLLHASHHGSRTFFKDGDESSEGWTDALEAIDPDIVIVSVGEDNRHGHPHEDMVDAYREQADDVYETSQTGTIVMEVDAGSDYRLILDSGRFADDYTWDEEEGESASAGALAAGAAAAGLGLTAAALAKRRRERKQSATRLDRQPAA